MPNSLTCSSCSLPIFFINNSTTQKHNPSYNPLKLATLIHFTPFKLKPSSILALHTPALRLLDSKPETERENGKFRAEKFADRIKETPVQYRCKFVDSVIGEVGFSRSVGFVNDLIMGLVIVEEFDIALKVFDEMPMRGLLPDSWTYSILIRCYCKKDDPDEGRKVLDCMIEKGFRPNVVTLTILVNSFCSRGKIDRAFEVIEIMHRIGCKPNVKTYNCVLKGLCFVGRVEEAYKMLMSLKSNSLITRASNTQMSMSADSTDKVINNDITREKESNIDVYSYTAVMNGFCKVGRSEEATELLEEAIQNGLTPNVITYNTLFNGYCKEGKPGKGIRLLKQMKDRGCMPDHISYTTLLHGLLKWNKILAGFWVYNQMLQAGFSVDERMMNTLLKGVCKETWLDSGNIENVDHVLYKMKTWEYTVFPDTYYLLSHTFCIIKKVNRALDIVCEMIEVGFFPRMVTINRIIHGLCEEERISEAFAVLGIVIGANRVPSKISYNILIDELNRQGNVVGACSVYGAALKLGVIPHNVPLCIHSK